MLLALTTVVIVSGCSVHSVERTESWPSQAQLEKLMKKPEQALDCPCSRLAIPYERFVDAHVEFHPVCSSHLVSQGWIDSIYVQSDDLRWTLSAFWQVVQGFCSTSEHAWKEAFSNFATSTIVHPNAIDRPLVERTARAALNASLNLVKAAFIRDLFAIEQTIGGNQLVSGLSTNYFASLTRLGIKLLPRKYGDCSCTKTTGCLHAAFLLNDQDEPVPVPGMIADCLLVDSVLASTLECYYNRTCLSLLHPGYRMEVVPLSITSNKHFQWNASVKTLVNELMIDDLAMNISFDSFYSECQPSHCSYTYSHRFDVMFIITSVIGTFGGLSVALRLAAQILLKIMLYRKNRSVRDPTPRTQSRARIVCNYLRQAPRLLGQRLIALNLFEDESPRTSERLYRQRITTRLFLVLLVGSVAAFGFYLFLIVQNEVITLSNPSVDTYLELADQHSTNLKCPCAQLSVPYGKFVNRTSALHQVCSSDLVSSTWIDYLTLFDPIDQVPPKKWHAHDIRVVAPPFFQLLASLCSVSSTIIENGSQTFLDAEYVTGYVIPPFQFAQEIETASQSFIESTKTHFSNTINWIRLPNLGSELISGTNVNTLIHTNKEQGVSIDFPVFTHVRGSSADDIYGIGVCECQRLFQRCTFPSMIYLTAPNGSSSHHYFFGLKVGCVPLSGLSESPIFWLYNQTLIDEIRSSYAMGLPANISSPVIKALDSTEPTRFNGYLTWHDLINEMFVENWRMNTSHFDLFYQECAPLSCSYTVEKRRHPIVALFLLVAIAGTLDAALQLTLSLLVQLIFIAHRKYQEGHFTQWRRHFLSLLRSISTLNLYYSHSTDEQVRRTERMQTRLYVIFVTSTMLIVILYSSVIVRKKTEIRPIESHADYEHLLALHANDIQCSCTRVAIPYSAFVSQFHVIFHPVCGSHFATTDSLYLLSGSLVLPRWLKKEDFRYWGPSFFAVIGALCSLAQTNINNDLRNLRSSTFITDRAISRLEFHKQIDRTLDKVRSSSAITFTRTLELLRLSIQGNALMTTSASNWMFASEKNPQTLQRSFSTMPVNYTRINGNTTCSCATSRLCFYPAQIYLPNATADYTIEGLFGGCFQLEAALASSLSCFSSKKCLKRLLQDISPSGIDAYHFRPIGPLPPRFSSNATVESIARAMFIDSIIFNVSYELFYNACAPSQCSLTYYYRFDALEVLTTFLSLFSGVALVFRFLVPHLLRVLTKLRNRFRVVPLISP